MNSEAPGFLNLRNLVKEFPGHTAVAGISLSVPRGSFFSLLGPSGCGKTTTLRLIAGFEQPTAGEVWLNGELINDRKPYQRNVSTVFQNYALFPHLTVRQNIEFGLRRHRAENIDAKVNEMLALMSLGGKDTRRPAQLSGGERQRVALARSLVLQPDVLLLDEPLAALDPKLRKQMRLELKDMQCRVGITFLFITHDQEEALSMSDQVAVMNEGRIEQVATPREIYLRPGTRFVAGFLGPVNWLGSVGIRPEATKLDRRTENFGEWRGQVTSSVFLGHCVNVFVRLDSGVEAIAQVPHNAADFLPGDPVNVSWNPSDEIRLT